MTEGVLFPAGRRMASKSHAGTLWCGNASVTPGIPYKATQTGCAHDLPQMPLLLSVPALRGPVREQNEKQIF